MISKVYNNYVLFDSLNFRNGIPQDAKEILRTLVSMNLFLPLRLIISWLDYNKSLCRFEDKLLPHEYLFLAANSQDRLKMAQKHISTCFDLNKSEQGIYEIDTSLAIHPNVDWRLETSVLNNPRVTFDFDKELLRPPSPPVKVAVRRARKFAENEAVRKFKEILKDPELIFKVKETITHSRLLLHKTQNNKGRFSYMRYRKKNGIMGSLESSHINLSKTITRNQSSAAKTEPIHNNGSISDILELKSEAYKRNHRPMSASTVKHKNSSRPQTGKRPKTGGSLASTVPVNLKDLFFQRNPSRNHC